MVPTVYCGEMVGRAVLADTTRCHGVGVCQVRVLGRARLLEGGEC
jgi:hypothetical protein